MKIRNFGSGKGELHDLYGQMLHINHECPCSVMLQANWAVMVRIYWWILKTAIIFKWNFFLVTVKHLLFFSFWIYGKFKSLNQMMVLNVSKITVFSPWQIVARILHRNFYWVFCWNRGGANCKWSCGMLMSCSFFCTFFLNLEQEGWQWGLHSVRFIFLLIGKRMIPENVDQRKKNGKY